MATTMNMAANRRRSEPDSTPRFQESMPLLIPFSPGWPLIATLFRIIGAALVLGAGLMWIVPAGAIGPDLMLIRLGLSVTFLLCGLALLMIHHVDNRPDAYFDPVRREVRVLQKDRRGRPQPVLRRSYDTLGCARFHQRTVEIFDMDGTLLMRLPVEDHNVRHALRKHLNDTVNITG